MSLRLLLATWVALAAAAPLPAEDPPAERSSPEAALDYRIGPEDVIQVSVWSNEAMSKTVPVRPDGKISLPLLNDVPAAGLTPMELRELIMKRLTEYVASPEVSVIVTEVRSLKVSVIGAVPKPDRYELRSRATVMDVLAMAGGFNEFASRSRIVVLRSNGAKVERIPFDYDKVSAGDGKHANFHLQAGDIVVVP